MNQPPQHPGEFDHFLQAQEPVYNQVVRELATGRKRSHWMWFIFPQIRGLGSSSASQRFAIVSLDQAKRYLDDPLLGQRLRQCTQLVVNIPNRAVEDIFGYPDDLKFRSSMTLFALAAPEEALFEAALAKYFSGIRDSRTLEILRTGQT